MLKKLKSRLESILSREDKEEPEKERMIEEQVKEKKTDKKEKKVLRPALHLGEKVLDEKTLDELLWDIELAMLENNVAEEAARAICESVKKELVGKRVKRGEVGKVIKQKVRNKAEEFFSSEDLDIEDVIKENKRKNKPTLILFFGFNGTGKTTTMAKIAHMLMSKNYTVIFAAADTFRAASIEQLEKHAGNLGIKVIKHKYGADPAAVIFDAMKYAEARGIDVVLADTAGRAHTDRNLLEELKKIVRVNKPDLNILVVEAIAGNDIVEQARRFGEVGIDGIVLTKWDVDERGGAAISVSYVLRKPILYLGTGQEYNDLKKFDKNEVLDEIIG